MLTVKQRECYRYLWGYAHQHEGMSPTFREIQQAMALKSKAQVTRLLENLEARGRIYRMKHHHRAIQVIPEPSTSFPHSVLKISYPNADYYTWDSEAKALVLHKRERTVT